ncbi:hypothetical protein CBR_g6369 [Chara braunii]|uniref:CCHC-type domain-containing protein n=1 Tax=Chara braunii TaxID=69332 RepID=A0A388KJL2_CHABU|nr:hypothetical protein CBR_g6369 [Chara braunii]|eukprot:GBG70241.1 hypothetical protein CBR_g6369 [Chara braunii]
MGEANGAPLRMMASQMDRLEQIMTKLVKVNSDPSRPVPAQYPLLTAPPAGGPVHSATPLQIANPAERIECYNFKQPGHFARECPQPKRNQPPPTVAPVALNQGQMATVLEQAREASPFITDQPLSGDQGASTSEASEATDVVDPTEYLQLAGLIGVIRPAKEELDWVERTSELGPQFQTGEIDLLQTLKQLDIRVPIPVGHLLTISEAANDKLLQQCQKNQKRFTYQRVQRMLKKKQEDENEANPPQVITTNAPEPARIAAISYADKNHFVRVRSVLWKSAECDCEVWGKPFDALIYTGSSAVAISLNTVRKTGRLNSILPLPGRDNYVSADEEAMNIVGIIENVAIKLEAISAILAQVGPDLEHVVEYASKTVPTCKHNYAAPTGECYAALWGISHFRAYMYGRKFTLVTDHEPLLALKKSKDYSAMIGRWATILQSMDFDIRHRKHERHGNADGFTRLHRPEKVLKSEEVIPWNEPQKEKGPRYGQVEILSKERNLAARDTRPWPEIVYLIVGIHRATPHESTGFTPFLLRTNSLPWVDYQGNSEIAEAGGRDTRATLQAKAKRYADLMEKVVPKLARERQKMTELTHSRQVTWTRTSEQPACIEYLELLILQAWRTDMEGDLLDFLFGSVWPGHRQLIVQELIVPIMQLADDLPLNIVSQSDDSPAPHVITRALTPYLQWTACLEEPGSDSTLPSRQEYLKPYEIIDRAFYPREPEEVLQETTEEEGDADEETSEEGSYSEYSEGEQSEEEEGLEEEEDEEEEAGSEWEDLTEEVARTGTEPEDPETARRREEIAAEENQLEIASGAGLCINDDPTRDPEPPEPKDGGSATAAPSTSQRRRSRSPSPSTPTRPPVRPRTDAGDRPSSPVVIPPSL